jgi:hypothetical protein
LKLCTLRSRLNIVIGYLHSTNTGFALLDAEWDFRRARRAHLVATIGGWMLRRRSGRHPHALSRSAMLAAGPSRLEVVPLRAIVGTLQPTASFDSDFRPASNAVRGRWARIALAHRKGQALPPVVLHRQPDGYYVVDGRHRVSVARALQHRDIDAWVTGPRREQNGLVNQGILEAGATGLEPATSGVTGRRSNQLSYAPGGDF